MLFVWHSWARVGLRNRFTMGHWSFDSQHWLAKPMSLRWAPKDLQVCYGESAVPLNSSLTLGCVVSCVVDVNDVYMFVSGLVGHTMGIPELQAFLGLWCWCWAAVGHILKLSPQGRPQSNPMLEAFNDTASLVWGLRRDWAFPGKRWGRRKVQIRGRELGESPACFSCSEVDAWGKERGPQQQVLVMQGKEANPASQAHATSRADHRAAGHGPPQLLTTSPSPVLQPVLWKTARLISFSTNLLRDEVLVPSMLQNWWMWERIFTFTSSEVMAFWDDRKRKEMSRPALCMDSTLDETCCQPGMEEESFVP